MSISIAKNIIHDAFDEEIVVVNLTTGSYYSLTGLACKVWKAICDGASKDSLLEMFRSMASDENVETFLALLAREGLVIVDGEILSPINAEELSCVLDSTPFQATLEKHTDAEELLLIDPIHEVDAGGWPRSA
jgi:hypothetical protein